MIFFKLPCTNTNNTESVSFFYSYLVIFVIFLLGFFFRDRISQLKEQLKASVRKWLYSTVVGSSIKDDSIEMKEGFLLSLVEFIDKSFLIPSEGGVDGTYDYLMENFEDQTDEIDNAEENLEEDEDSDDGDEEDNEDGNNDDEEEEEEEEEEN